MHKIASFWHRHHIAVIGITIAIVIPSGIYVGDQRSREHARDQIEQIAYENSLSSCLRGNTSRRNQYQLAHAGASYGIPGFSTVLYRIKHSPGVDPTTGAITCSEVVEAP